jgi:hypothetical protein
MREWRVSASEYDVVFEDLSPWSSDSNFVRAFSSENECVRFNQFMKIGKVKSYLNHLVFVASLGYP